MINRVVDMSLFDEARKTAQTTDDIPVPPQEIQKAASDLVGQTSGLLVVLQQHKSTGSDVKSAVEIPTPKTDIGLHG